MQTSLIENMLKKKGLEEGTLIRNNNKHSEETAYYDLGIIDEIKIHGSGIHWYEHTIYVKELNECGNTSNCNSAYNIDDIEKISCEEAKEVLIKNFEQMIDENLSALVSTQ